MRIENGDTIVFATGNANKVELYKNVLAAQGISVKLYSLKEAKQLLEQRGKSIDLSMPPEDTVETSGTYAGNSLRKAEHVANKLQNAGVDEFAHAKVIADDWGAEVEGLYWSVDKVTGAKQICTLAEAPTNTVLHPFPGLDTRPFTDSFGKPNEREQLGLSEQDYDLLLNERAMHAIADHLKGASSPRMDYTTVLSLVDVASGESDQFKGRLHGTFHYPPIKGEHGFGTDMCMQPLGHDTTLSNTPNREAKGLVAEAAAVAKAVEGHTKITKQMIDDLPVADIHVHVPGTVTPQTAWELGVRNRFIAISDGEAGKAWHHGDASLHVDDPHEHYANIFRKNGGIKLDQQGKPLDIEYDIDMQNFKNFDGVMATVQGHRHPPGGIQTEDDFKLVLSDYLKSCVEQKIFYTELQQNIKIAHQLYPNVSEAEARKKFTVMLKGMQEEFAKQNVHVVFLHCFNKTGMANDGKTPHQRAIDGAEWLKEARDIAPGVFVGLESAGHEKDQSGWPDQLKAGYDKAKSYGFGCEAHGGEGIGVEHMMDVVRNLPLTRLAHGFQSIEDPAAIHEIKDQGITLVMSPCVNVALGSPIHKKDGVAVPKSSGGEQHFITQLNDHPFFPLLREYEVPIALATDNPGMGGVDYKTMVKQMAGLVAGHAFTPDTPPLSAEELATCSLNAINAAFCSPAVKQEFTDKLSSWMKKYDVRVEHDLLRNKHAQAVGESGTSWVNRRG